MLVGVIVNTTQMPDHSITYALDSSDRICFGSSYVYAHLQNANSILKT